MPRLRSALLSATGGSGKASDVNFARLQAELDEISRENVLRFKTPPFFTVIIRSLTILEGVALSVDPNFRLVRGSYPYVLRQLLAPEDDERTPVALQNLLIRILTVNGEGEFGANRCNILEISAYALSLFSEKEIDWERLRDLLRLAQKSRTSYDPSVDEKEDKTYLSRQTIELFFRFLTSRTGLFLKKPLVHELAQAIDGMASIGEANLIRTFNGFLPALPGMNGPVNARVMDEMTKMLSTFQDALKVEADGTTNRAQLRLQAMRELLNELASLLTDERLRQNAEPLLAEVRSVVQMVAVEVLEIRGSRAVRSVLRVGTPL